MVAGSAVTPAWTAFQAALADSVAQAEQGHRRRRLRGATRLPGGRVRLADGRTLLDVSSNDYLGLALHPDVTARAADYALRLGAGSAASRLVSGTLPEHLAVERKLAAFKGCEAALLFASGWQANAAVLPTLIGLMPGPVKAFADRLNHASLHAGLAQARMRQIRFRHNDLDHLDRLMGDPEHQGGTRLIVTESVFSMDGDRADLEGLLALAQRRDAILYVDEAHATGVLGPGGAGLCAALPAGAPVIVMGTLGKALGGFGAYVAGTQTMIDALVQTCGGFIYSTAPPPAVLGALDAALDLVPTMEADRARLRASAERVRRAAAERGLHTFGSSTQIVPIGLDSEARALQAMARLEAQGLLAIAIRPPTVPEGSSRLRLSLSAAHGDDAIDRLVAAIGALT
jgi:8-amino-7-oxononanoate synthase